MDLKAKREELTKQAIQMTKEINNSLAYLERKREEAVRLDAQIALLDQLIDDGAKPKAEEAKQKVAKDNGN